MNMSSWDKIVAYSTYITLLYIYEGNNVIPKFINKSKINLEPIFLNSNHGFRPKKSCHTALNDLNNWGFCSWFIKVDIKTFFNRIRKKRLLNIIRETIDDEHLLSLIQQMLNAEVLINEIDGEVIKKARIGIPQENLLSQLLINIYLHKIDEFVKEKLKKTWNKTNDPEKYEKSLYKSFYLDTFSFANELKPTKTEKQKNKLRKKLKDTKLDNIGKFSAKAKTQQVSISKIYHKVYYVRYADDFIFGIRGPKSLAIQVKDEISLFLKSDLHLELKNANLYHAKSNSINYLNFEIKIPNTKESEISKLKKTIAFSKLRNRAKLKKQMLTNKWKSFLDRSLRKKMENQVNEILGGITKKVNADQAINQVAKNTILEKITEVTKSMLENVTLVDKEIPLLDIKEFMKQWRSEVLTYLKDGWIHKDSLKNFVGGAELIKNHEKLIKSLNKLSGINKVALMKKNKIKKNEKYMKQSLRPKLYVPQRIIIERMKRWGMIDSKSNKPIVCNTLLKYHEIQFIEHFKSKAKGLLEYYRPASNHHW